MIRTLILTCFFFFLSRVLQTIPYWCPLHYQTPSCKVTSHTKSCLPMTSLHVPGDVLITKRANTAESKHAAQYRDNCCAESLGKVVGPVKKECRRQRRREVVSQGSWKEKKCQRPPGSVLSRSWRLRAVLIVVTYYWLSCSLEEATSLTQSTGATKRWEK